MPGPSDQNQFRVKFQSGLINTSAAFGKGFGFDNQIGICYPQKGTINGMN
jgi:hypothetical protein